MTAIRPVSDHVAYQARLRPDALAVFDDAGPVSYRTLVHDVDALATELLERGLTRDDLVGLDVGRNYLHVLLILALDRLSIPSLSFSRADPVSTPRPPIGMTVIVGAAAAPVDAPCRWITMSETQRPQLGRPDAARLAALDSPPDALIRVCWSSGSTGAMKASPLTRRIQAHRLEGRRLLRGIGPGTRYIAGMPLSSTPGYGTTFTVLSAGGAVILPDPAADFVEMANALAATLTNGSPVMVAELMGRPDRLVHPLRTLSHFEVLGAHLPSELARDAMRFLTPNLWILYGSTEANQVAQAEAASCLADPSAVGHVTPWCEAEVVDDDGRTLSPGQEGLLRVRGDQVIAGYYKDDAATRRNFRDGWFYPGDIGAITDEGLLRVTGRVEDVIKYGGAVLSPLPIEEAMRGLPGVRDVAVFPMAGPGGTDQMICAALVLDPGADLARIRAESAARLGSQAPARLFTIDKLPRNANGKVVRRGLIALAERSGR